MLHQTLPGVPQAVDDARAWIETAVRARHPRVSAVVAVEVCAELVSAALRHTPDGGTIEVRVTSAPAGGVIIEVRDPNEPSDAAHTGSWAEISRMVRDFGASSTASGHIAWCRLPEAS